MHFVSGLFLLNQFRSRIPYTGGANYVAGMRSLNKEPRRFPRIPRSRKPPKTHQRLVLKLDLREGYIPQETYDREMRKLRRPGGKSLIAINHIFWERRLEAPQKRGRPFSQAGLPSLGKRR